MNHSTDENCFTINHRIYWWYTDKRWDTKPTLSYINDDVDDDDDDNDDVSRGKKKADLLHFCSLHHFIHNGRVRHFNATLWGLGKVLFRHSRTLQPKSPFYFKLDRPLSGQDPDTFPEGELTLTFGGGRTSSFVQIKNIRSLININVWLSCSVWYQL